MKLRRKPGKKPVRKKIKDQLYISKYDSSLKTILDALPANIDLNDVYLDSEGWWYGEFLLKWERKETDEEYQKRVDQWQDSKKKYKEWYEKNKEEIDAELAIREKRKKIEEQKRKAEIKKQIEKLQKKLKEHTG